MGPMAQVDVWQIAHLMRFSSRKVGSSVSAILRRRLGSLLCRGLKENDHREPHVERCREKFEAIAGI